MKRLPILLVILLGFLGFSSSSHALPAGTTYSVTPIVGFEQVTKARPDYHAKVRLIYGALVTAGYRIISAESEITRASDNEYYPLQDLRLADTDDRIKLGIRSEYPLLPILSAYGRLGGQASRNTHEEIRSGVSTKTIGKIKISPYFGLGVVLDVVNWVALQAGATVVFNEWPDMSKNDYQTTFGVTFRK